MANNIAFQPMGSSTLLSATTTTSTVSVTASSPSNQLMISNTGNVAVFVNISANSSVTAVLPTAGTPQPGVSIPSGAIKVISNLQISNTTVYVAGITATGSASVYLVAGEGL